MIEIGSDAYATDSCTEHHSTQQCYGVRDQNIPAETIKSIVCERENKTDHDFCMRQRFYSTRSKPKTGTCNKHEARPKC